MRGTCCAWILWRCAVIAVGSCAGAKAVDWRHVRIVGHHFCYWFVMDSPSNGIFSLGSLEWQKAGGSISLGKWAVLSYLVFAFLLFLLILISLYSENDGGSCGSAGMAVYFRHFLFAHLRRRLPCVIFHHVFFFRLRRDAVGNAQEKTPWT